MAPHAMLLPYPAQGHVVPFLELAYCLADHGVEVTFIVTESIHDRVTAAASANAFNTGAMGLINMVSVPDGLSSDEERRDFLKLGSSLKEVFPRCIEEMVSVAERVACLITDHSLPWMLPVAKRLDLRPVSFWPAAAAALPMMLSASKFVENGYIDATYGRPKRDDMIQLGPGMPSIAPSELIWNMMTRDSEQQEIVFKKLQSINQDFDLADTIICNSFQELESSTFTCFPKLLPIGPLLPGRRLGKPVGHLWPDDPTCLTWLDEQPANSVVYVAFGSFTVFRSNQFCELALGLELTGRPFLWVVRPDLVEQSSDALPAGFRARVASRGRIVVWSPQQQVLAHPAISCFVTHCGWNSIMEGITNGVPFLCWPYFTDQFLNRNYVCDVWKTGLKVTPDEKGLVSRDEFKSKVEELLGDADIKAKALELKDLAANAVTERGSSSENFKYFIDTITLGDAGIKASALESKD